VLGIWQRGAMHKSKLAGFIIDCQTEELATAAAFWGAALGMPTRALAPAEAQKYVELIDPLGHVHVEVQSVAHPSRVHLDIETDDIEAEVRRLEALGAKRIGRVKSWWVMEAPTGQRFCVVVPQSPRFADQAHAWT
jgi:predicted enzyme related to lactoylglutathione lyase